MIAWLTVAVISQYLNDVVPNICVIALPERRSHMQRFLQPMLRAPVHYIQPVMRDTLDLNTMRKQGVLHDRGRLGAGDVATALSHRRCVAWYMQGSNGGPLLTFEDDVTVAPGYNTSAVHALQAAMERLPAQWDVFYAGVCWDSCWRRVRVSEHVYQTSLPFCMHSIVYSRYGAAIAWNLLQVVDDTVDSMMADAISRGRLTAYVAEPSIFRQNNWLFNTTAGKGSPHKRPQAFADDCRSDFRVWYGLGVLLSVAVIVACRQVFVRNSNGPVRLVIVVNVVACVFLILTLSMLFDQWPYPMAFSWMGFACSWFAVSKVEASVIDTTSHAVMVFSTAAAIGFVNLSLQYNAVGTYELLKSFVLPLTVFINIAWYKEKLSNCWHNTLVCAVAVFVFLGVFAHPLEWSLPGVLAGFTAAVASATEKTKLKHICSGSSCKPLGVLRATLRDTIALLAFASFLYENKAYTQAPDGAHVCLIACACALSCVVSTSNYIICGKVSPVVYCCLSPVKTVLVVTLSNSWGKPWNVACVTGAASCGFLYSYLATKRSPWTSVSDDADKDADATSSATCAAPEPCA